MAKSAKKPGAKPKAAAKPRKPAAKKTVVNAHSNGSSIHHEEIAQLAHRFWTERGRRHGHHEEDWLRAERELSAKAS
ncbi:MAG: DUF2934 domain-containing protein [Terracidiphilus sp.]|jgi:hypothetical protein